MHLYQLFITPFTDYGFMRRALAACITVAAGSAPLGVFLVLRQMTLMGDAASHAILPGAAIAFLCFGVSLIPMTIGGLLAGLLMAIIAALVTRSTRLKEDASFTAAYLTSLAIGVVIISMKGSTIDLLHVLFGNVLAVDGNALKLINAITGISLLTLAIIYRPLIMECFDPQFMKAQHGKGAIYHHLFLVLVILNLVASFQTLGTLMAVGIMVLPAIATRFWTKNIDLAIGLSIVFAIFASITGLLLSYHFSLPSGPAIILSASGWYGFSIFFGPSGGLFARYFPKRHFHNIKPLLIVTVITMLCILPDTLYASDKLTITSSFSIIGDMVHEVVGDQANLVTLAGVNADVHTFEPTPKNTAQLAQSDIIFINGLGLEGWINRLITASGFKGKIITLGENINAIPNDPHAWQSVHNAILYVTTIKEALIKADSSHALQYQINADTYVKKLEAMDAWARQEINTIPNDKRQVISTHDAFGYFARDYGIRFIALQSASTESQPSAADIARIIDEIRKKHIKAIFLENMTDPRLMQQIEQDTNAHMGGTLYSDALSETRDEAGTYLALFHHNVRLLVDAMQKN